MSKQKLINVEIKTCISLKSEKDFIRLQKHIHYFVKFMSNEFPDKDGLEWLVNLYDSESVVSKMMNEVNTN